ncbi:MAG: DUF3604 domain-containing protein [Gammaproteobacteria bacterium]|nr:DUF3604 domain-containing protein [Gammaproteobacteria bacterium]
MQQASTNVLLRHFTLTPVLLALMASCTDMPMTTESSQEVGLEMAVFGGLVRGIVDENGVKQYHGIPYAAPPVGDLRWAPPAPVTPWTGVRDASEPGPICIQHEKAGVAFYDPPADRVLPEQSEDCLTLNVWTMVTRRDEGRPVMVWIHGGGLAAGWGARSAGPLLAEKGAVLVSFNYRLGRLGFLAHPELSAENPKGVSGNQGFRDQIQALEWVRDNIAQFGGDPGNVTIFGESAGGTSVSVMQASPMARGLFHRVIGQSGAGFHPMQHRTRNQSFISSGEAIGLQFGAALVGEQADQSLAVLREVPAQKVLEVSGSSPAFSTYEYLPTVDGEVLVEDVGTTFANGRQADVPVMVGSASDEGAAVLEHFMRFLGPGLKGFNMFGAAMLPEGRDEIPEYYPATTDEDAIPSWQNLFTDMTFTYPMRAWARSMDDLESEVYLYWFTWPVSLAGGKNYGAFHGSSQIYVFSDFDLMHEVAPKDADVEFSHFIADTWVRFAKTGNPNGGSLPEWPAFTPENEVYMDLGLRPRVGHHLRMPQMALVERAWDKRRAANLLANPERTAYFGDLHVHTTNSFDAFLFGGTATIEEAYQFAKGAPVTHLAGYEMKLKEPLDFYAVTDHAFLMGAMAAMKDPTDPMSRHPDAKALTNLKTREDRIRAFMIARQFILPGPRYREIDDPRTIQSTWAKIIEAANRHNDPGRFTTFIGYEWSSAPQSQNLHRNVIFKGEKAPVAPFSRFISSDPEDLWRWMDVLREQGLESLAIPHNANGSGGQMFSLMDFSGNSPLDADYAQRRVRNEPLVEITQVKGTSETHPVLSPYDEWADFEIMPYLVGTSRVGKVSGSYVREAWLNGLKLSEEQGFDPFKFGVIGSSDSHNGSSGGTEDDFWGKMGTVDGIAKTRGSVPLAPGEDFHPAEDLLVDPVNMSWGSAGLAGVWAEQNTRDAIYEAMRRKETFGTSGTRIKVRFFAGYDLPSIDNKQVISKAYAGGVPMGADLAAEADREPSFIVWALRDALSAPLQRVQIIKGWVDEGEIQEKVFDVACSDGGVVDPVTHRCPDNNAKVNIEDCSISGTGAGELKARWRDPEFNADQRAFYYARVLEDPICRWSTWDAVRAGVEPRKDFPKTIQERAWSSPIWYMPGS